MLNLPDFILSPYVEKALAEDLNRKGDVTSQAIIDPNQTTTLKIVTRETGKVAGLDLARLSFKLLDNEIAFKSYYNDGDDISKSGVLAEVHGNAWNILAAERTALNFLGHLSGIATKTADLCQLVAHTPTKITCTRKTLPGLRTLQKYAVRVGGGTNHRMGLDDMILIKDNHIALAGSISAAIQHVKQNVGHLTLVEVEVDTLTQLEEALNVGVNLVLLDNMPPEILREAVAMCRGRVLTEASGGIDRESIQAVAETGVDFIAVGALTHSVRNFDIGLDYI